MFEINNTEYLLNLIKSRRSIRSFNSKNVSMEDIMNIIEAGIWAPSGTNQQEIKFIIIKNKDILNGFSRFKKIKTFDTVILLLIDFENYYSDFGNLKFHPHKEYLPYIDTGLAMMNMMLVAESKSIRSLALNVSPHLFYDDIKSRNLLQRVLRKTSIKLNKSLFGIHTFYDFCKNIGIDTTKYIPAGAIGLGYSSKIIDINKHKHGKQLIQRKDRQEYIIKVI